MDVLTQAVLGAATAGAAAPRRELRVAAAAGAFAGVLPDADAFIRSAADPLVTLEYHRHFTHALAFVPVGALLAALLLAPLLASRIGFPRLYGYCFLGYGLAGLLDACTSYGTHLLWPLSDARIAFGWVSIVDPLFTLALLVPLGLALRARRRGLATAGLVLGALYLGVAALQHQRAAQALHEHVAARGQAAQRALVKPTFANIVLWRGLYLADGRLHTAAIRVLHDVQVTPGEQAPLATPEGAGAEQRFAALSDGWVVRHPEDPRRLGDARFAMLPTSLRPLWGIERGDDGRARLFTDRRLSAEERGRFLALLLGRGAPP